MTVLPLALAAAAAGGNGFVVLRDAPHGIEATIAPEKGGELTSLRVRHRGKWIETLYRAADYSNTQPGWTGKAPWLWPATGRNTPLPAHGFARDQAWKLDQRGPKQATVSLRDSPATRALYDYGFRLTARYTLANPGKVAIKYTVAASDRNSGPMPFSAGNHITFRTPLVAGSDAMAMTFESPSTIEYMKADGIPTGASRPRSFAKPARLGEIEKLSAVSLAGYEGDPWMILRDPAGLGLRISQHASSTPPEPVVRFNVWGDPGAGYFSPEPWVGLQNGHNSRQGLVMLKPGETWEWTIEIEVLR